MPNGQSDAGHTELESMGIAVLQLMRPLNSTSLPRTVGSTYLLRWTCTIQAGSNVLRLNCCGTVCNCV